MFDFLILLLSELVLKQRKLDNCLMQKYCTSIVHTLAKVKILVITRSEKLVDNIGICSSTVKAVQQPLQQRISNSFMYEYCTSGKFF